MKRRFEFRLGRLLRVRSIQEEVARGAWSAAEAEARAFEEAHRALVARLAGERENFSARLCAGFSGLTPGAILKAHLVLDVQARGIATAHTRALAGRARADVLAARWREVERECSALTELEERERDRHRAALERAEEAERDERASSARQESPPDSSPPPQGTDGAGKLGSKAPAPGSPVSAERRVGSRRGVPPSVSSSKSSA